MDEMCEKYSCEKLKTTNNRYICFCSNRFNDSQVYDYAIRIIEMCREIISFVSNDSTFKVHVGVATGPYVQGVLYGKRISYDVWGESMQILNNLTLSGSFNKIIVCSDTYNETNFKYSFEKYTVNQNIEAYRLTGEL